MAALGAVGKLSPHLAVSSKKTRLWNTVAVRTSQVSTQRSKRLATWAESAAYPLLTANTSGRYGYTVKQNGVPLPGCKVALYWRNTCKLVGWILTDAAGNFEFTELVNTGAGDYFIVALDPAGAPNQNALIYDRIVAAPPPPPPLPVINSFTAVPNTGSPGVNVALTWGTTDATAATIDQGIGSVAVDGTMQVTPAVTTAYTLTATNTQGSAQSAQTVTVTAPPPPGLPVAENASFTLAASTTVRFVSNTDPTKFIDKTLAAGVYNCNMSGLGVTDPHFGVFKHCEEAPLLPPPPVVDSFTAVPNAGAPGVNVALTWNTTGANSASLDQGIGAVAVDGTRQVTPAVTTTYTLTATNTGGSAQSAQMVTVTAPPGGNIDTGTDLTVPIGDISMNVNNAQITVTASARSVQTAAGIFHTDGRLLRTLWRRVILASNQSHSVTWDYLDDMGNLVPDGAYKVKVIAHNVGYKWQGVIGNSSNPGFAGIVQQNFTMGGQTLSMDVVKDFHRGFCTISDMAFGSNGVGFYCTGYNEQQKALYRVNVSNMNRRDPVGHDDFMRVFERVATDGAIGYFANTGLFGAAGGIFDNPQNFIVAFRADGSEVTFPNGSAWTQGLGSGNHWASVIDIVNDGVDRIQGLAVDGANLYVAHKNSGIKVFNKTTGAFIRTFASPNPSAMAIAPNGELYVAVNGGTEVRRYANPGSASPSQNLSITGFGKANGLGVSPLTSTLVVVDSGTDQQIKAYNAAGSQVWTQGVVGGYSGTGPSVSTTKFNFKDNISPYGYVAFEPASGGQELFWVGESGNSRNLKFRVPSGSTGANPLVYVDQIMYVTASYKATVDKTNPTRVFSGWQEFAVDYSQPFTQSWSLVKNWGGGVSDQIRSQFASGFQDVFTVFPQNRTYAVASGAASKTIYELASNGLRDTGIAVPTHTRMVEDGSLRFSRDANNQFQIIEKTFTGIDGAGNPQYSADTVVATAPKTDARAKTNPMSFWSAIEQQYPKTTSGLFVTFNPGIDLDLALFHLGAIKPGTNTDFVFRASPAGGFTLNGNGSAAMILNGDGTFNIERNEQNYGGSIAMAFGRHMIYNYFGEFWNQGQANQNMHWLDNGLFLGQFGIANYPQHNGGNTAIVGAAGNTFSGNMTVVDGNVYIYHNDESVHGGVHRWRIQNLNTIQEMVGNIGRNTAVSNPAQIPSQNI